MNKNKKPIIGVTVSLDESGMIHEGIDYSFIRRDYGDALNEVGADVVYIDPSIDPETVARLCDGIVISGGQDIQPFIYGEEDRATKILEPARRTLWERKVIDACDSYEVPILGICYGQQVLNIHYGGTIYQDIASEHGSELNHGSSFDASVHKASFLSDGLGYVAGDTVHSTSRHHQAVKTIAPGFEVVATADDGIIEAIKGRGHYGIQWHPEADGTASRIYGAFVQKCIEQPVGLVDFLPEPNIA